MTTENEQSIDSTVAAGVEVERLVDGKPLPAPGAEEQKPKPEGDSPAPGADDKKPDAEQDDPVKQAERKLSRRQRAYQRERDLRVAAETETKLLREQAASRESSRQSQEPVEPKRENFESYEAYLEARSDWRADQKVTEALKKDREATQAKEQATQIPEAQRKAAQAWMERETAFKALTKDYDEVVGDFADSPEWAAFSGEAKRAAIESDVGPQLLYHLASNPEEAERIAALAPRKQIVELDALEAKLPKAGKKASAAPPPASVPKGGNTAEGFREDMSQKDYEARRKSQGSVWAPR